MRDVQGSITSAQLACPAPLQCTQRLASMITLPWVTPHAGITAMTVGGTLASEGLAVKTLDTGTLPPCDAMQQHGPQLQNLLFHHSLRRCFSQLTEPGPRNSSLRVATTQCTMLEPLRRQSSCRDGRSVPVQRH